LDKDIAVAVSVSPDTDRPGLYRQGAVPASSMLWLNYSILRHRWATILRCREGIGWSSRGWISSYHCH